MLGSPAISGLLCHGMSSSGRRFFTTTTASHTLCRATQVLRLYTLYETSSVFANHLRTIILLCLCVSCMAVAALSWYREFKRLYDCIPCVEVQTLKEHHDQVLHLAFSHRGHRLSSCSKDCTVKVRYEASCCSLHKDFKYPPFCSFVIYMQIFINGYNCNGTVLKSTQYVKRQKLVDMLSQCLSC